MEQQGYHGFLRDLVNNSAWRDDHYRGCAECSLSGDSSNKELSASEENTLRKAQKLLERIGENSDSCKRALLKHSR